MPRFVVLFHELPTTAERSNHWDFMLEEGGELATWALASEPADGPAIQSRRLPQHRLTYLDYTGEISGGRGFVRRFDDGTFDWISQMDTLIRVRLAGEKLSGVATLSLLPGSDGNAWEFRFSRSDKPN